MLYDVKNIMELQSVSSFTNGDNFLLARETQKYSKQYSTYRTDLSVLRNYISSNVCSDVKLLFDSWSVMSGNVDCLCALSKNEFDNLSVNNKILSTFLYIISDDIDETRGRDHYVLPVATSAELGGIKVGFEYAKDGNYPVEISNKNAYVNVMPLQNEIKVCQNNKEISYCKENRFSMTDVNDDWIRFGQFYGYKKYKQGRTGTDIYCPGTDENSYSQGTVYPWETSASAYVPQIKKNSRSGFTQWSFDDDNDTITQLCNSTDFVGFVSDNTYKDYTFECIFKSLSESDDDMNGIVAGFVQDANNNFHTISFMRSPNNNWYYDRTSKKYEALQWYAVLDEYCNTYEGEAYPTKIYGNNPYGRLVIADSGIRSYNSPEISGYNQLSSRAAWSKFPYGVRVRVRKVGNKFIGSTTRFFDNREPIRSDMLDQYNLTVDIDELLSREDLTEAQISALQLFRDSEVRFGVCNYSQTSSSFEMVEFPQTQNKLGNISTNEIIEYNKYNDEWETVSDNLRQDSEIGKFSYNEKTKKLYYNNVEDGLITVGGHFDKKYIKTIRLNYELTGTTNTTELSTTYTYTNNFKYPCVICRPCGYSKWEEGFAYFEDAIMTVRCGKRTIWCGYRKGRPFLEDTEKTSAVFYADDRNKYNLIDYQWILNKGETMTVILRIPQGKHSATQENPSKTNITIPLVFFERQ